MSSEPDTDDERRSLPEPPQGYDEPLPYGENSHNKTIASYGIGFLLAALIVLAVLSQIKIEIANSFGVHGPLTAGILLIAGTLLLWPASTYFHELTHAAASRLLGNEPKIHWEIPNPHVSADGQLTPRVHAIITLLAPFIVLNGLAIIIFFESSAPAIRFLAIVLGLANTAGSGADIYGVYRVSRMPKGTLTCTMAESHGESYVYYPSTDTTND